MAAEPTTPQLEHHEAPLLTGPDADQKLLTAPHAAAPPPVSKPADAAASGTDTEDKAPPKKEYKGHIWKIAVILLIVFGIFLLIGLLPRLHRQPQINDYAKAHTNVVPVVNAVSVQAPPAFDTLVLPGNIQAVQQTAITARAAGYLKKFFVDIGDRVHTGQLLATISTPDVDQSVAQARAQFSQAQAAQSQSSANLNQQQANLVQQQAELSRSGATYQQSKTDLARANAALAQAQEASAQQSAQLTQATANLNLARVTAQRYQNLLAAGAIDQQTTDQAVASYQTNQANVASLAAALRAGQANVSAFRAAVLSSQANVKAFADGIRASQAQVGAAAANVQSYRAAVTAAIANVRSAQANVARNSALQGFQNVTAPFNGIVTARNVDTGALISTSGGPSGGGDSVGSGAAGTTTQGNAAGGSSSSGSSPGNTSSSSSPSLFSIAQIDTLLFYVSIPQTYLGIVGVGQPVQVTVQETPGRIFTGTIVRTAGALDATSRTLVAEVRLNNRDGALRPGMFAQATIRVPHPGSSVVIPGPALVTNAQNTQVLVIGQDNKVHFQPVTVGRDFGTVIEITQGLHVGQQLIASPSDSIQEGEKVKVAPPQPKDKSGS
ncbi:MAG: efflux RND transporter periplasmic adaptor subunit [Janthinobacterium lividum]